MTRMTAPFGPPAQLQFDTQRDLRLDGGASSSTGISAKSSSDLTRKILNFSALLAAEMPARHRPLAHRPTQTVGVSAVEVRQRGFSPKKLIHKSSYSAIRGGDAVCTTRHGLE
jgi:hypothetical protein